MARLVINTAAIMETIQLKNTSKERGVYVYFKDQKTYILTKQNMAATSQRHCFICLEEPLKAPHWYYHSFEESIEAAMKDGLRVFVYDTFDELSKELNQPPC